ncbi:MAG: HYR domain-containing protein, partial [Betaproteobacteria bacterium]|nr:HYR domain-containing protein [Betaproteobacteria bacterium]
DPDGDALAFEWSEGGVIFSTSATLTVGLTFGVHDLSLKVTDPSGASSVAGVKVSVVDTTAPVVNCPASTTAATGANAQAAVPNVLPGVVASDLGTPAVNLVMTQSPVAGTLVGLGTHMITVTVVDAVGNSSSCTTAFTVVDQTPPVVEAPQSVRVVANANKQAAVPDLVPQVVATDDVTPTAQLKIVQSPAAGTLLGLGSYVVTITVTDAAGNQATATTSLEIVEGTPTPHHVCLSVTPHVLRPADRRMVPVRVTVHSRGTVALKCKIVSITSDEPAGSPGHPSEEDWAITGDLTALLRAEASVHGNGRVYTLVVRCTDASGKSSSHKLFVRVPRPCRPHHDHDDKEVSKNNPSKN